MQRVEPPGAGRPAKRADANDVHTKDEREPAQRAGHTTSARRRIGEDGAKAKGERIGAAGTPNSAAANAPCASASGAMRWSSTQPNRNPPNSSREYATNRRANARGASRALVAIPYLDLPPKIDPSTPLRMDLPAPEPILRAALFAAASSNPSL